MFCCSGEVEPALSYLFINHIKGIENEGRDDVIYRVCTPIAIIFPRINIH